MKILRQCFVALVLVSGQAQAQDSTLLGSLWERLFPPARPTRPVARPTNRPAARPVVYNDFFSVELRNLVPKLENIPGATAQSPDADRSCARAFRDVNLKNRHRIVVGFGYSDTVPKDLIYDVYARNALYRQLTAPCGKNQDTLCGFRAYNKQDPDTLTKTLMNEDGRNFRIVEVRLIWGSMSASHAKNVAAENREKQMALCKKASENFNAEIANGADTVIYFGHARNGGGPDFCPPYVTGDGQHVDYPRYQRERGGINGVTNAIKLARKNGKRSSLIALIGCNTQLHFRRRILNAAADQGAILTNRTIQFGHVWHDTLAVLAGSIQQSCGGSLQDILDEGTSHGTTGASVRLNYL